MNIFSIWKNREKNLISLFWGRKSKNLIILIFLMTERLQMTGKYHYFTDDATGRIMAINTSTGETIDTITFTAPVGTIAYTPEQQRLYRERKEKEMLLTLRRVPKKFKFTFIKSQHEYKDISPETVGRLMYLITYLTYNSTYIGKTQKTRIKKKDLANILQLPRSTFIRFWKDVEDKYLFEDTDGYIQVNDVCFYRGAIPKKKIGEEYQKLYIDSMRELYRITPTAKHRYLGYVFQMLPFINKEYNILCYNPAETALERIEPITVDDFCCAIGYNVEQRTRLIKQYSQIDFNVDNHKERFCSFVFDGVNFGKALIYVNPNILYKGNKWEEVKVLGTFCK